MDYLASHGGDSQNFLRKFVRFFVTLGLKILRLLRLRLKYFLKQISLKGDVNYYITQTVPQSYINLMKLPKKFCEFLPRSATVWDFVA